MLAVDFSVRLCKSCCNNVFDRQPARKFYTPSPRQLFQFRLLCQNSRLLSPVSCFAASILLSVGTPTVLVTTTYHPTSSNLCLHSIPESPAQKLNNIYAVNSRLTARVVERWVVLVLKIFTILGHTHPVPGGPYKMYTPPWARPFSTASTACFCSAFRGVSARLDQSRSWFETAVGKRELSSPAGEAGDACPPAPCSIGCEFPIGAT